MKAALLCGVFLGLFICCTPTLADSAGAAFAGKFANDKLTVELHATNDGLEGTITLDRAVYPALGKVVNGHLAGSFKAGGTDFEFTAGLSGDAMTLTSGSGSYSLKRITEANPLAAPPPATAPATLQAFAAGNEPNIMRFVKYSLQDDPTYIGGEAFSMLIPAGWKVEGGMVWNPEVAYIVQPKIRIFDPHSFSHFALYPNQTFYWSALDAKSPIRVGHMYLLSEIQPPVRDPFEAIAKIVIPRLRPDLAKARVVETEKLPDLAKSNGKAMPPLPGMKLELSAGRTRVEYVVDGQGVQEDFVCILRYELNPQVQYNNWSVLNITSIRAAKGQLDAVRPVALAIQSSTRLNLNFYNKLAQLLAVRTKAISEGAKIVMDESIKRQRIMAGLSNDISEANRRSWEQQQRNDAAVSLSRAETNRDEQGWTTAEGNRVELPYKYGHVWQGANGEFITTNDPLYNPNSDPNRTSTYTPLQKAPDLSGHVPD